MPSYLEYFPKTVSTPINTGFLLFLAFSITLFNSLIDSPFFTSKTSKFIASNLSITLSLNVLSIEPSNVTLLASYISIKLFNSNVPANEQAS